MPLRCVTLVYVPLRCVTVVYVPLRVGISLPVHNLRVGIPLPVHNLGWVGVSRSYLGVW